MRGRNWRSAPVSFAYQREGQVEPCGEPSGFGLQFSADLVHTLVAVIADLGGVGVDRGVGIIMADKDVIELEFRKAVIIFRTIGKGKEPGERSRKAQLFAESADGSGGRIFPRTGMTATGICPQP